ncbi:MAG: MOSC domain-containing protein [Dehalococcoidia bacterium]
MRVGTVARLFRYPVKSMRGEEVSSTPVTLQGVPGDRRFAFVQAESRSIFPWLTARQVNAMLRYRPFYPEGFDGAGREPALRVQSPAGMQYDVRAAELRQELEQQLGKPLFLLSDHRGNYDVGQVSVFSLATVAAISAASGMQLDPRRFRANLYVEPAEGALPERDWVGKTLAIGPNLRLAVTELDDRCMMITLDPDGAASEPAVLKTVATVFGNKAGVYASVVQPGTVNVGDAIEIWG